MVQSWGSGDVMRTLVCLIGGLLFVSFQAIGDVVFETNPLPGYMNSARAIYAAPASGDSEEDLAAFQWAMENYTLAVRAQNYPLALKHGLKALELGEQLDSVSSEFCANLAMNLGRIYRIYRREPEVFRMYDRSLGHFTDAFGENSGELYLPVSEILLYSIRQKETSEARKYYKHLKAVVELNFDFPSENRGYFYIFESKLHRMEVLTFSARANPTSIRRSLAKALKDFEAVGHDLGTGDARFELGKHRLEARKYPLARTELALALEAYERAGLLPGDQRVLQCHLFLAEAWIRSGKDDKATPHLQHVSRHQGEVDATQMQPLIRVAPEYPERALESGIEGWVLMEFTVTVEGKVRDPRVVDSRPSGIFERAAKKAVLQWRYVPLSADGVPVEAKTEVILRFILAR